MSPDPSERVNGAEFLAVRVRLGLTQADIAKRLGVGKRTVEDWEGGRNAGGPPYLRLALQVIEADMNVATG